MQYGEVRLPHFDAEKLQQQETEQAVGNSPLVHPSTTRIPVLGGVVL